MNCEGYGFWFPPLILPTTRAHNLCISIQNLIKMNNIARRQANGYENVFILTILALTIAAGSAQAHKLNSSVTVEKSMPTGIFHYADGVALSYAEVKVWSPGNDEVEFQNGRTDKNGRFSFVPDRNGVWRIEVADGLGHAAMVEFEAENAVKTRVSEKKAENGILLYAILGISLLFNLAFIIQKIRTLKET